MSMNGLLPGLSNFWFGYIGSCQYRIFRPLASMRAVLVSGAAIGVDDAADPGVAGGDWCEPYQNPAPAAIAAIAMTTISVPDWAPRCEWIVLMISPSPETRTRAMPTPSR